MKRSLEEYFAGMVAGWAQVIINQPFDFIKTKFQTESASANISYWARNIYKQFGVLGFYRGSSSIFFGTGLASAFEFTIYELFKRTLARSFGILRNQQLSLSIIGMSGFMTGFILSTIYCPLEYSKLFVQTHKEKNIGSLKTLLQIAFTRGIKPLYTGWGITALKQSFGGAIYFGAYQAVLRFLNESNQHRFFNYFIAGSFGGVAYWTTTYPGDIVKTKVQTGKTYKQAIKECIKQKKFYRGFKIVLLVCIPSNGANFFVYEHVKRSLYDPHYHF